MKQLILAAIAVLGLSGGAAFAQSLSHAMPTHYSGSANSGG